MATESEGRGHPRPSWDEYFLAIAGVVAGRSTCLRRKVGAVLVRHRRILTTGYNGAPRGIRHCDERGCLRDELAVPSGQRHELCRGLHAEMNALLQAAVHGVVVEGATLYCTNQPCSLCTKMLVNSGVRRAVVRDGYPDELATELMRESGMQLGRLDEGGHEAGS